MAYRPRSPRQMFWSLMGLALAALTARPVTAAPLLSGLGGPAGFGTSELAPNDDGFSSAIDISPAFPGGLRFFGMTFNRVVVNTNGNLTFGTTGVSTFTPRPFPIASQRMIAPFWADVDTRGDGRPARNGVYWDLRPGQMTVTWHNVGYFSIRDDKSNDFQLILRGTPECGMGDFDVEFRYNRCEWTTGGASGGVDGLGGTPAQAGFDAGDMAHYYALPGSFTMAVLDLCRTSNVGEPGVWRFQIRGGELPCMGSGAPCDTGLLGVCAQGSIQCRSGVPTCVAEIQPGAERCDGLDNDCDGMIDEGEDLCGAGSICDRAVCVPICVEGGCFEGQTCTSRGTCVETSCRDITCAEGQRCEGGRCLEACEGISCPSPTVCRAGRCVDACADVTCDPGNVCDEGRCVLHCNCRACGPGQVCGRDGRCSSVACATVTCEDGLICDRGRCIDPCDNARCPRGQVCIDRVCTTPPSDGGTELPPVDAGDDYDAGDDDAGVADVVTDAGTDANMDAGTDSGSGWMQGNKGCACRAGVTGQADFGALLSIGAAVGLIAARRRRRR